MEFTHVLVGFVIVRYEGELVYDCTLVICERGWMDGCVLLEFGEGLMHDCALVK